MKLKLLGAAIAAVISCAPSSAATIVVNAVVDPSVSTFFLDSNAPRSGSFFYRLDNGPFSVASGDVIEGLITFAGGSSLEVENGATGTEMVTLLFAGSNGPILYNSQLSFQGIQGDYVGATSFTSSQTCRDCFATSLFISTAGNLTNSSFSFSGLAFRTTYTGPSQTFSPFNGGALIVRDQLAPPIPPVPEPATWAMMLVGFGAVGHSMRRSRRFATSARLSTS